MILIEPPTYQYHATRWQECPHQCNISLQYAPLKLVYRTIFIASFQLPFKQMIKVYLVQNHVKYRRRKSNKNDSNVVVSRAQTNSEHTLNRQLGYYL